MARILVTRPIGEAQETAQALAYRGHDALIDPMLVIYFRDDPLPDGPFDAVVVSTPTSRPASFA